MLNKWTYLSILTITSFSTAVEGWGRHSIPPEHFSNPEMTMVQKDRTNHFPLNLDQQWFTKASYLLWKPQQDDLDYANAINSPLDTPVNVFEVDTKTKKPHNEWSSGFRFALGLYMPHHQQWDLSATMTYVYSEAHNKVEVDPSLLEAWIDPLWSFEEMQEASESTVKFNMNYYVWDLLLGRNYTLTSAFSMHPFIGLRSALIDQTYKNKNDSQYFYDSFFIVFEDPTIFAESRFKAENQFWGVGPRIGTDFDFGFGRGWSILGNLSGSFLVGHYNIKETINGFNPTTDDTITPYPIDMKIKDGDTVLRTNLEAAIGLGWEKWVDNHSTRIALSFMVEGSEWFSMNHWFNAQFISADSAPDQFGSLVTQRHYGNLSFWGYSFNLQIDF